MFLGDLKIYLYIAIVMSVIEEISKLSRNGCDDALLNARTTMKLNVNLMEMSIRNPESTIVIFALTATWKR